MTTTHVRAATPDDDQALLELDRRAWDDGSAIPSLHDTGTGPGAFFSPGGRTPDGLLVAELDGTVVGMVKIRPKLPMPEAAHVFSVLNLIVSPQARRQGVASTLLAAAEDAARARGARKLSLMVLSSNPSAIALYARHGFVVEGRHVRELLINDEYVDDLSLAKPINP